MINVTCNIALIHPPHIFNRERYAIFPLPWNLSHVGSTRYIGKFPIGPRWNVEPIGFATMKNFVESNSDYTVGIINLASLKSSLPRNIIKKYGHLNKKDPSILNDLAEVMYPKLVVSTIKDLKADLFAVDLHWLISSQGAIEILKLLKKIHPRSYTLVGGLTASYFKDEIMKLFPFIDFLIAGDGCIPLLKLIEQIKKNRDFSKVPNLMYRDKGVVKSGPRRFLNDFNYAQSDAKLFRSIPTSRGCPLRCLTCGGSKYSSKKYSNYARAHAYSIESIMRKLLYSAGESGERTDSFLIHDPFFTMGKRNWGILLDEIKGNKLNVSFIIEFFSPHSQEDIYNIAEKIPGSSIHISPESMDEGVRSFQRNLKYSNSELVRNMEAINNSDSLSMEIWFMTGLARDTKRSIDKTLFFIRRYYKKIKHMERNFIKYNELLFIDPGSLAFDFPHQYGYGIIAAFHKIVDTFCVIR